MLSFKIKGQPEQNKNQPAAGRTHFASHRVFNYLQQISKTESTDFIVMHLINILNLKLYRSCIYKLSYSIY